MFSWRLLFIAEKLQNKCVNCGIFFEQNNDDLKTDICKKCVDPKTAKNRKRYFEKSRTQKPEKKVKEPNKFEKRMIPYGLMTIDNFLNDYKKFNHMLFAVQIQRTDEFKTDLKTSLFYVYNEENGIWENNAKEFIGCAITQCLGTDFKTQQKNEITEYIKLNSYNEVVFNEKKIALKNCYFDPITQETTPFNSDEMVIYSLNATYDPEVEVPKEFIDFINSSLDQEEKTMIQELMGFCLIPDYRFQHIFWIYGSSRAGKGVWARTMKELMGSTFSSVPINHLNGFHRFSEARLYRKLCNICNEPTLKKDQKGNTRFMSVQTLNSLTGQDPLSTEIKGVQNPLEFTNKAKIIIISNELPRVREQSDAFYQRLKFIHFKKQFLGKEQIKNYEKKWTADPKKMSGILNFAIEGLQRLLKNQDFIISESEIYLKKQFIRNNDTFKAFLEEKTFFKINVWIPRKTLYENYVMFCQDNELFCLPEKFFNSQMRYKPQIREVQKRFEGKRERVWLGIQLKEIKDSDQEITSFFDKKQENGTHGTYGTPIHTHSKKNINYNDSNTCVPTVPSVPKNKPLLSKCYFCSASLPQKGWVSGKLSKQKPAHTSCYTKKEQELIKGDLK